MANSAEFDVVINAVGNLEKALKQLKNVGSAVQDVDKANKAAADSGKKHNEVMNGGVASANNSARSMSKLIETVNGGNGLVAAYATLATNAFAVSAAFNVLKNTAQVTQLFQGLEAAGARTGRTLTTVAQQMKELTGAAISTGEAMRFTAQAASAGINTSDIERLTKVATASAKALGRDVPDSMNRLIMAVTKGEPELVDELGLTIKMTQAQEMYARQTGKTASSLTVLEKQQALLNAWASQGEAKFSGLAKAVDSNPYDQLASSFADLTNDILSFVNNAGVAAFVRFLATDKLALSVALLLFANTVKSQVLPVFAEASKAANKLAADSAGAAAAEVEALQKSKKELIAAQSAQSKYIGKLTTKDIPQPQNYKVWVDAVSSGTDTIDQQNAALKSLNSSIGRNEGLAKKAAEGTLKNGKTQEYYNTVVAAHKKELESANAYIEKRAALQGNLIAIENQVALKNREVAVFTAEAAAQTARADSIESLSKRQLKATIDNLILSYKEYSVFLREQMILKAEDAGVTNAEAVANTNLARSMIALQAGSFAAVTGIKAVGSALLTALPYLALVTIAIDGVLWLWDKLKPDSWKKLDKAFEDFSATMESTNQKIAASRDIELSNSSAIDKSSASLTNKLNTMSEAIAAYQKYNTAVSLAYETEETATRQAIIGQETLANTMLNVMVPGLGTVYSLWDKWKNSVKETAGVPIGGIVDKITDLGPTSSEAEKATAHLLATINANLPNTVQRFADLNKNLEGLSAEAKKQKIDEFIVRLGPAVDSANNAFQELKGTLTELGNSWTDFIRGLSATTPYDQLSERISSSLTQIDKFKGSLRNGLLDSKDVDKYIADLNTTMGQLPTALLGNQGALASDALERTNAELTSLKNKQLDIDKSTAEYAVNVKRIAELEALRVKEASTLGSIVSKNLTYLENDLHTARLTTIEAQGQLSLAQARLSVLERQGVISVSDLAKQINAKNNIIQLQAKQASLNVKYLELEVQKKEFDLERAKNRAKEIEDLAKMNDLRLKGYKLTLEMSNVMLSAAPKTQETLDAIASNNRAIAEITKAGGSQANIQADSEEAKRGVEVAQKALEISRANLNAAKDQVAALLMGQIDSVEKAYELGKQGLEIKKSEWDLQKNLNQAILNYISSERTLQNIKSSGLTTTRNEFDLIKQTAAEKRLEQQKDYEFSRASLNLELAKAEAQGRTDAVDILNRRIKLLDEENSTRVKILNNEERISIYQKIDLDTQEKKLSLLQDVLGYYVKIADQASEMLSKEQDLYKLRLENKISRTGGQVSETAQKAIEAKAAKEQLELAEKQLALRKIGISLEYDVLEAKRILLNEELKAKKAEADRLSATAKTPEEKAAADNMSKTLGAAIEGIGTQSYNVLKQNALKLADMDVEILREKAQKAYNDLYRQFAKPNLFDKFQTAFANIGVITDTIFNKKPKDREQVDSLIPPALINTQKELVNAINTNFPELVFQLDKIANPKTLQTSISQPKSQKRSLASMLGEGGYNIRYKGEFGKRLEAMLNKYFDLTGRTSEIPVASGIRSTKRQQEIWDGGHTVNGKRYTKEGRPIGRPGSSLHESENAIDISSSVWRDIVKRGILKEFGLMSLSNDPGHIQLDKRATKHTPKTAVSADKSTIDASDTVLSVADKSTSIKSSIAANDNTPKVTFASKDTTSQDSGNIGDVFKSLTLSGKITMINEGLVKPILESFTDLGNQITERLGVDFGPQGKIISALSNFSDELVSFSITISNSIDGLFRPKSAGIGRAINNIPIELSASSIWSATTVAGSASAAAITPSSVASADTSQLSGGLDNLSSKSAEMAQEVQANVKTADSAVKASTESITKAQEQTNEGFSKQMKSASTALSAIAGMIGAVAGILKASSDAKLAAIDKEIAAEEKRDGKSAASVAKIDALEKKKDATARKSFNTQKKLMMAQAVVSTAAGIAGALGSMPGPAGIVLASIIGAMGAAQIAIIAGTSYESSYTPKSVETPSNLSIGKRGDTVDLAKGPNANAGGEISYLRGASGTGTNASNYRTIGSAYGGELMRGYGNRGFVVGEKGPEVITPETPITVTPANDVQNSSPINANISIHAIDSQGVQDVLVSQKGNIIKMLREAANASGQRFMEDVDVNVYTRPSVGKL